MRKKMEWKQLLCLALSCTLTLGSPAAALAFEEAPPEAAAAIEAEASTEAQAAAETEEETSVPAAAETEEEVPAPETTAETEMEILESETELLEEEAVLQKLNESVLLGSGTAQEPYQIANAGDAQLLAETVAKGETYHGKYLALTADLTLPAGWTPVGAKSHTFQGTFLGGGHLITVPEGTQTFFGSLSNGASVQDLNIYGARIAGCGVVESYDTGQSFTLENIVLKSGTQTLRSGFVGGYGNQSVYIRNCTVETGVVIGYDRSQSGIGSFGGDFNGVIENCTSNAAVYGVNCVGGIAGSKGQTMREFSVSGCSFGGSVTATGNFAGGIAGSGYAGSSWGVSSAPNTPMVNINNCTVTGSVAGNDYVGGILGAESGMAQCWENGKGSITGNFFQGTVSASGKYAGGVIGYMHSLNRYTVISGNTYYGTAAVPKGIGGVWIVDTAAGMVTPVDGVLYINTNGSASGCPAVAGCSWRKDHFREDDPLGADLGSLVTNLGVSDAAVKTPVENPGGGVFAAGGQQAGAAGQNGNKKPKPQNTGGSKKKPSGGNAKTEKKKTIRVSFTLLGDSAHGDNGEVHTLTDGNLTTWISEKTYTLAPEATVLTLLEKALKDNGCTFTNQNGNYVSDVTRKGVTLSEFTNGANSGWMYTKNGVHSDQGISEQTLKNGDAIVFHYTDDYTKETSEGAASGGASVKEKDFNGEKAQEDEKETENAKEDEEPETALEEIYRLTGEYLYRTVSEPTFGSVGGEWAVFGLARAGYPVAEGYFEAYYQNLCGTLAQSEGILHPKRYTDYSRTVLALDAMGRDAANVAGWNLLEPLTDFERVIWQGINGAVFGLLALDAQDYETSAPAAEKQQATREKLVEYILDQELVDGGWALNEEGPADTDITAMAIQALAPYYEERKDVKKAVERGLKTLGTLQDEQGGFSNGVEANSESAAQVITALCALGIDPRRDERFLKNGRSVLDALADFCVEGGGFCHTMGDGVNGMATEQGFYALAAYQRYRKDRNGLYDMRDVKTQENMEADSGSGEPWYSMSREHKAE